MMQKVVIIIPIHKANPTKNELASFVQCYKVLGSHPIRVLAPEGINTDAYTQVVKDSEFLFIDKTWLSSIEQYNKLKISLYFYNLFKEYEYLLTYELDAWVFRDELLYWCDKGYDYIGAPWFEGYHKPLSKKIIGVGNSGFSLRNINIFSKILYTIDRIKLIRKRWFKLKLQSLISFDKVLPFLGIKIMKPVNLEKVLWNYFDFNEDYFWCVIIPSIFSDFHIAEVKDACLFSFDARPAYLYQMNGGHIPFGCHAWKKYEPEFWKEFIPEERR